MSFIDWQDLFNEVFEDCYDSWILAFLHRNDMSQHENLEKNCAKMTRTGYAHFHCKKCSKTWSSAKAQVILYHPKSKTSSRKVTLRFYGQQCKRCSNRNNHFVDPEFEDDKIKLYLEALYQKFGWYYYGEERPETQNQDINKERQMNGPHVKELCEACQSGCCERL
ncbi:unnamed protein product [Adineta steineri]|uniref:3CxxC-type domain-containing protein n=1 Tax=Adineta steineri TaxID=433720 RepID=A0A819ZDU9_9BILA|nr:unnamed protein product [Adineta steineri]CAF1495548.1 unnamed protein product [Adineta steineri]CAF4170582.1 unnamed protein product [Adineta steineri]